MLLKKIVQNSAKNINDEKIYYQIVDSYFKNWNVKKTYLERLADIKKLIRFYVRYISFLKKNKENNLEFIMTILHDIKNPMISVDYALRAIKREDEILENIYKTNRSMLNLIEDLLSDYKFDLNLEKLNVQKIVLEDILDDEICYHTYLLKEKNTKVIKKNFQKTEIYSDKKAISRLFSNLIANAINHSPKNSIIELELKKCLFGVCFSTKNKNKGQKINKNLFDFSKEFGLGLYIVKKILKKISGKFKIENAGNLIISTVYLPISLNKKQ